MTFKIVVDFLATLTHNDVRGFRHCFLNTGLVYLLTMLSIVL